MSFSRKKEEQNNDVLCSLSFLFLPSSHFLRPHFSLWRNTLLNTHKHVSAGFFFSLWDRSGSHDHHLLRDIVSWTNFNSKNRNKTIIMIQSARKRRATAWALSKSYYWELSYSVSCPFKPVISCVVVSPHQSLMNSELGPGEDYQANLISALTPESHGATGEDVNKAATHPPCLRFLFLFRRETRKKRVAMSLVNGSLGCVWVVVLTHLPTHTRKTPSECCAFFFLRSLAKRWRVFLLAQFPLISVSCSNHRWTRGHLGKTNAGLQGCSPWSDL